MKGKYYYTIIFFFIIFICGCNTLQTVKRQRGDGASNIYAYPHKMIYRCVRNAIFKSGLTVKEENIEEGCIFAEGSFTEWSWGEWVAVYVEKIDEDKTRVEIVSRKKVATNLLATDWSKIIFPLIDGQIINEKNSLLQK